MGLCSVVLKEELNCAHFGCIFGVNSPFILTLRTAWIAGEWAPGRREKSENPCLEEQCSSFSSACRSATDSIESR